MAKKGLCSLLTLWDITLPLSVGPNANAVKSASRREQLVCYMKAEGHGDPNFKATKLGTGERERFIAAVTVFGQQFKTYPKTFPSKVG